MRKHASVSLAKYKELLAAGNSHPLKFKVEPKRPEITAYIDPENTMPELDRLSQVMILCTVFFFKNTGTGQCMDFET